MKYIDKSFMDTVERKAFIEAKGFPWLNLKGFLNDSSLSSLINNLPDLKLFERSKNIQRPYGQLPHDRLYLQYEEGIAIPTVWQEFIEELNSSEYKNFLKRLYNLKWHESVDLYFHWHYAENGGSVSPHCDGKAKLGSHLFYLNTDQDWDSEWGGQTLALINHAKNLKCDSAPTFEDFDEIITANCLSPYSFIFARTETSWHGVKEIHAPEGKLRKIFIVVIEKRTVAERLKYRLFGQPKRVGY